MNIPNYISSGVLELYVAGALPEQEAIEVTTLIHQHEDLREAVELVELAFIRYAELHAPPIPLTLETNILGHKASSAHQTKKRQKDDVIPMRQNRPATRWWRLAAALAIFLMASLLANLYQYNQLQTKAQALQQTEQELIALKAEKQQLATQLQVQQAQYTEAESAIAILSDPTTQQIQLNAVGQVPKTTTAQVYWHQSSKNLYVLGTQLPEPPPDKSYQLWALTDMDPLTPVDAGILADYGQDKDKLFKVKDIGKAVAFAITLEPKGGSQSPTLDQLKVLGQL